MPDAAVAFGTPEGPTVAQNAKGRGPVHGEDLQYLQKRVDAKVRRVAAAERRLRQQTAFILEFLEGRKEEILDVCREHEAQKERLRTAIRAETQRRRAAEKRCREAEALRAEQQVQVSTLERRASAAEDSVSALQRSLEETRSALESTTRQLARATQRLEVGEPGPPAEAPPVGSFEAVAAAARTAPRVLDRLLADLEAAAEAAVATSARQEELDRAINAAKDREQSALRRAEEAKEAEMKYKRVAEESEATAAQVRAPARRWYISDALAAAGRPGAASPVVQRRARPRGARRSHSRPPDPHSTFSISPSALDPNRPQNPTPPALLPTHNATSRTSVLLWSHTYLRSCRPRPAASRRASAMRTSRA